MTGVLAMVIAGALVTGSAGAGDEAASIKDLMGKLHKGAKAPLNQVKAQLKSDSPDWAKIKSDAKEINALSASLAKFDPPKGDAAAYKALAATYHNTAKALDAAAEKEDLGATKAACTKLSTSCKECHSAHKGQ
jgi:cytochrome c556